ncbi:MAG: 1,3-beta-galactosyl-N-acetylhexosamine phosphorylase [Eubacterium sp.]|nr:1,3-beta-galactosyl-N-acetylhexosamine phosphorylase [Eubacterium sp.]
MNRQSGDFTLPGEAGYEKLTLELAEKWGADVIRDSDGTQLSKEILDAGYDIYSTVCIIRDHNEWLEKNPDKYQQSFLMSYPVMAEAAEVKIDIIDGFYKEQFLINASDDSIRYWEVFDRTQDEKVDDSNWSYDKKTGIVTVKNVKPFHYYTVNFLVYRIWEEISMYNHVTNNWDKEHLAPLDPRSEEAQAYLIDWLHNWCKDHESTNVVRFTSLFYNFVWIWGNDDRNRNLYTDWGSYDFTVSPLALDEFAKKYGYSLTSEDFINKGKLHVTHMPPTKKMKDYYEFTQRFVCDFGKKLVDIVHSYGKKAYVFYDDSWVGLEPYGPYFKEYGFDGLIKCVFSGYESRLCAGVDVPVHELRLHPYLFPVGLGGLPTFSEGGNPKKDTQDYWVRVRRALVRAKIDRLGLGGYLHLTQDYPDFIDYVAELLDEFRMIKKLQEDDVLYTIPVKVAVLHAWGSYRSWTLSGHFHETWMHTLIHINESLSGFPMNVDFISFEDIRDKGLDGYDVVINAGKAGSAWSGGENWDDSQIVTAIQKWVYEGGVFLGVGESSAWGDGQTYLKLGHVFGLDIDTGAKVCHGRYTFNIDEELNQKLIPEGVTIKKRDNVYLTNKDANVILEEGGIPKIVINPYGSGYGVYISEYEKTFPNMRMLFNIILYCSGYDTYDSFVADNIGVECAFFKKAQILLVINNTDQDVTTDIKVFERTKNVTLKPYEMKKLQL